MNAPGNDIRPGAGAARAKRWTDADGIHIDVRELAPPGPLVAIVELIASIDSDALPVIVHHERDPVMLYGELAERGWTVDRIATLFGLLLIGGWLLTFLLGILQRIVPFLASMHAGQARTRVRGLPPTPSALTAERPLATHFACHLGALVLLALAILIDSAAAARAAAVLGTAGALAYGIFFAIVVQRMRPPKAPAESGGVSRS